MDKQMSESMTDSDRARIMRRLKASIKAAKAMTPEQARALLHEYGYCDKDGNLVEAYGGTAKLLPS